jgi:hypothetical protein
VRRPSRSCKSAVSRHESRQHWSDQLCWIIRGLSARAGEDFSVSKQIAMNGAGSSIVNFTGLSSTMAPSLSLAMFVSLAFVWFKHQVTVDDDPHRETWPDCQCWLNVEIALNDVLANPAQAVA